MKISKKAMIRMFWMHPNLRPQIPKAIENARRKYFAISAAADEAKEEWNEMENEYLLLKKQEKEKEDVS